MQFLLVDKCFDGEFLELSTDGFLLFLQQAVRFVDDGVQYLGDLMLQDFFLIRGEFKVVYAMRDNGNDVVLPGVHGQQPIANVIQETLVSFYVSAFMRYLPYLLAA